MFSALGLVQLALSLLKLVLSNLKGGNAQIASDVTDGIQAAITKLEEVTGTDVTYQQLESLRVEPKW